MAFEAFAQRVKTEWRKGCDEQSRQLLIKTAREGHAKIIRDSVQRGGIVPEWNAYANHAANTNIETVVLPGPIVYEYHYRREIYIETLKELYKFSPVESGRYRDSHTLYVNGYPVVDKFDIKPTDDVFIANPLAYARRLEVGLTTEGRPFLVSVPNRIYERVARFIAERYKSVAKVEFIYVTIPGAYIIKGRLPKYYVSRHIDPTGMTLQKRRQQVGQPVRSPAISIRSLVG